MHPKHLDPDHCPPTGSPLLLPRPPPPGAAPPRLETPEARAMPALWEEVSGAASGFQRWFIAGRVRHTFFGQ